MKHSPGCLFLYVYEAFAIYLCYILGRRIILVNLRYGLIYFTDSDAVFRTNEVWKVNGLLVPKMSCPFSKISPNCDVYREKHRQSSVQFSSDIEDISTLNLKHLNEAISTLTNPPVSDSFFRIYSYCWVMVIDFWCTFIYGSRTILKPKHLAGNFSYACRDVKIYLFYINSSSIKARTWRRRDDEA